MEIYWDDYSKYIVRLYFNTVTIKISKTIHIQVTGIRQGIIGKKLTKNMRQECYFEYGKQTIQANISEIKFWLEKN